MLVRINYCYFRLIDTVCNLELWQALPSHRFFELAAILYVQRWMFSLSNFWVTCEIYRYETDSLFVRGAPQSSNYVTYRYSCIVTSVYISFRLWYYTCTLSTSLSNSARSYCQASVIDTHAVCNSLTNTSVKIRHFTIIVSSINIGISQRVVKHGSASQIANKTAKYGLLPSSWRLLAFGHLLKGHTCETLNSYQYTHVDRLTKTIWEVRPSDVTGLGVTVYNIW